MKTKSVQTKNKKSVQKLKKEYFDYYDDIKHFTKGKEDW